MPEESIERERRGCIRESEMAVIIRGASGATPGTGVFFFLSRLFNILTFRYIRIIISNIPGTFPPVAPRAAR
jgi:hypothetical protein